MSRFACDGSYEADLETYRRRIFEKYGVSSQTAEREIMYLADQKNTVAQKLYADMLFYKKILSKSPYGEAFSMYMHSAGIFVDEGEWKCSGVSYPLAFWIIGYYLVNYGRSSVLKDETGIPEIDALSLEGRLSLALELAVACIDYVQAPGAVNLVGRILREVSGEEALYGALKEVLEEQVSSHDFSVIGIADASCSDRASAAASAEAFFRRAADEGYVYACNSLAVREADAIIAAKAAGASEEDLEEALGRYEHYLKLGADKYEPYAANRLGLFYIAGEVKGQTGQCEFKGRKDSAKAKICFTRATIYPDSNSAWAYLNLIKYFHNDYATNLDFLNEHMDRIRDLNPKVYDIAMEL